MPLVHAVLLPRPHERDINAVSGLDAAAKKVGAELKQDHVATLVVLQVVPFAPTDPFTPPTTDPNALNVLSLDKTSSNGFAFDNDVAFIDELVKRARPAGWMVKRLPQIEFDPETMASLATIGAADLAVKVIVATLPYRAPKDLVDLGIVIGAVAKESSAPIAIVAIANLSSRLTGPTARAEAKAFDAAVQEALTKGDVGAIVSYDLKELEAAGEEAARAIAVLHGAAQTTSPALTSKLGTYVAPTSTGYAVATWS